MSNKRKIKDAKTQNKDYSIKEYSQSKKYFDLESTCEETESEKENKHDNV